MSSQMREDQTQQRVALVTGAARRVGRAIVEKLAAEKCDVAFTYLNSSAEADDLVQRLQTAGRRAMAVRADLTRPQEAVQAIQSAFFNTFQRLDVLVNNASIYEPGDLRQATAEQLRRMWAIHVESPLLLCRAFEQPLRAARGHVVNMVDILADRPWPQYLGYCASKAALLNLTLALARELAPEVTVNGIAPGVVEWAEHQPQEERQKYLKRVPLERPGSPRDVAEAVHFLVTAGNYITGQILRLDGGRSVT